MSEFWQGIIIAAIPSFFVLITMIYQKRRDAAKDNSDVAGRLISSSKELIDQWQELRKEQDSRYQEEKATLIRQHEEQLERIKEQHAAEISEKDREIGRLKERVHNLEIKQLAMERILAEIQNGKDRDK